MQNGEVVPYYSRAEIDGENAPLTGDEILWVDDKHALFFLHIQGSGLVQLPDGEVVGVGYRDQNGHPYRSIGKLLVARGEMQIEEVNLFSLRYWLRKNPARADDLLNENPSYVFFSRRAEVGDGPIGALGVMLTPERSLAADFTKSAARRTGVAGNDRPGQWRAFAKIDVRARFGRRNQRRHSRRFFLGTRRPRRNNGGIDEIARQNVRLVAALIFGNSEILQKFPPAQKWRKNANFRKWKINLQK